MKDFLRHILTVVGISIIANGVHISCDVTGRFITFIIGSALIGLPIYFIKDNE